MQIGQLHVSGTVLAQQKVRDCNKKRAKRGTTKGLPENVGKYSKIVDKALPGKHTRQLYDRLSWKEAVESHDQVYCICLEAEALLGDCLIRQSVWHYADRDIHNYK